MKYCSYFTFSICTLLMFCLGCQGAKETTSSKDDKQATEQEGRSAADHAAASRNSGKPSFMEKLQAEALKTPFKGITTSGEIVKGLFPVKATGVSTEQTRLAAEKFLAALSQEQRDKTVFPIDDDEWRRWSNVDNGLFARQGVSIKELEQSALLNLAKQYVSNMDDGHAKVKLAEIKKYLADTYFAWIGSVDDDAVFYYESTAPSS